MSTINHQDENDLSGVKMRLWKTKILPPRYLTRYSATQLLQDIHPHISYNPRTTLFREKKRAGWWCGRKKRGFCGKKPATTAPTHPQTNPPSQAMVNRLGKVDKQQQRNKDMQSSKGWPRGAKQSVCASRMCSRVCVQ